MRTDGPGPPQDDGVVEVPARALARLRVGLAVLATLVLALGGALALALPRTLAYDGLLEENLELRTRVRELDQRMAEVDRILMRLRLYDAQLRGLAPDGDHGPLDAPPEPPPPDDAAAFDEAGIEDGVELRPADAWADAVLARAESFVDVFEEAEPDLNALVVELEDLRALEEALPTQWPARGTLTSDFGYRRSPFGRRAQFHKGLDISNDRGEPIVAAAPGVVVRAFYNGGYGRFIEIDHGYGITSRYAHLHRMLVQRGDTVARGQQIGTMGRTGRVTGTHLHFEVRIDGHAVDPLDYLPR